MRVPANFTDTDLQQAHDAAEVVASERFRPYLPGRLLPMLVARFRDDTAEALGMELPPLPKRPRVRPAKLSELTSREFDSLSSGVEVLVKRFTACMDDPELPRLLRDFHDALMIESAERARIQRDFGLSAKAAS